MVSNKKIGTDFEKRMCDILNRDGWWVHFIEPKPDGSQPFDIIAVKNGSAMAMDCKTCVKSTFSIDRLEDNQILAFEKWLKNGNSDPYIAIEHRNDIYVISYTHLKKYKSVKLEENYKIWK